MSVAIILLIVIVLLIWVLCYYFKLDRNKILEFFITGILLPVIVACLIYIFIDYSTNQRSLKNLKLDIDAAEVIVTQKNEYNYDIKLLFSQGDILNAYLFRINKDNKISCEKIKEIDREPNSISFSFQPSLIHIEPEYDNSKKPYPYTPLLLIPDIEQFVLYFEDYYGNTYYKYLIVKPKFDLTDLPYFLKIYGNDEIYLIHYPIILKRELDYLFIDTKFSNKKYIESQLNNFPSIIEDYMIDPNTKPLVFSNGNKWELNPKVNIQYSVPTADQIIQIITLIMTQKNY